jgi:hypothetical protein
MAPPPLITPFWFKQRQCKAEAVDADFYRITGPNLPETFLGLRRLEDDTYQGYFRRHKDGPDDVVTERTFDTPYNGWEGAFELFRAKMIL